MRTSNESIMQAKSNTLNIEVSQPHRHSVFDAVVHCLSLDAPRKSAPTPCFQRFIIRLRKINRQPPCLFVFHGRILGALRNHLQHTFANDWY